MGINLFWEDENGKSLGTVIDDKNLFAHALEKADLNGTICLRFIDRYGDTTFNQLQVPVLSDEIKILKKSVEDLPTLQQIDTILALIQNSKEAHTYLKFFWD